MVQMPQITFNVDKIPEELKARRQWICWKYEIQDDKLGKVPVAPWATGHNGAASVNDPQNMAPFELAVETAKKNSWGIGFCFFSGDGLTGVDLDKLDALGGEAEEIVKKANSYAEYSPSGKGMHFIGYGKLQQAIKKENVEAYSRDRYFTVTGAHVEGTSATLGDIQGVLDQLKAKYGDKPTFKPKTTVAGEFKNQYGWSLNDIRQRDRKLDELLSTLEPAGYPSPSEADMACLSKLLFWGYTEAEDVEILLCYRGRDKLNRDDYVERTLRKVTPVSKTIADLVDVKKWNPKTGYHINLIDDKYTNRTGKGENNTQHMLYVDSLSSSVLSAHSDLKLVSSEQDIIDGVFKYLWKNKVKLAVKISDDKKDLVQFESDGKTFTDNCKLRTSEHSRKMLAGRLEEKQILFKTEALELLNIVSNDLNSRKDLLKPIEKKESEVSTLENIVENEIDVDWLLTPDVFSRALKLLSSPNLLSKLETFIHGLLISDIELRKDIISNQISVCAPPLRRYNPYSGDYVLERGQETLLAYGKSGTGKGALLKLLRLIGVRVVVATRITRPVLERFASIILHHTTLCITEIENLYKTIRTREGPEEAATDVATVLKQAIEDNKIMLVVMEHDEDGRLSPRVYLAEVYPSPVMTSIKEVKDVQMKTRAKLTSLPQDLAGFLQIGSLIQGNIMVEGVPKIEVDGYLSANEVKLVFHLVNGIVEGIVWSRFVKLSAEEREEIERILRENGFSVDYLKPVEATNLNKDLRDRIFKSWVQFILEFTVPPVSEVEGDDGPEKIERKDLIKKAYEGKIDEVIEEIRALGLDISKVEGLTRDLLHAFRRVQSNCLLHQFNRNFKLSGDGQKRILEANVEDCDAGLNLLRNLMPQRVENGLTSHELAIVSVLRDSADMELTAKDAALKFYGQPQVEKTRINYVLRVLNKASELGYLTKITGKPHRYKFEGVETATLNCD